MHTIRLRHENKNLQHSEGNTEPQPVIKHGRKKNKTKKHKTENKKIPTIISKQC